MNKEDLKKKIDRQSYIVQLVLLALMVLVLIIEKTQ